MKLVNPGKPYRDLVAAETESVSLAVPAQMMTLMFDECRKKGWVLRMDVVHKLTLSCGVPLRGFDSLSVQRLAKVIDDHATQLLHDISPDAPQDGLHIVAMFVLFLVDRGLIADVRAVVVVVALLLMEDIKDEKGEWPFRERFLKEQAGKLLAKANRRGLYNKIVRLDAIPEGAEI